MSVEKITWLDIPDSKWVQKIAFRPSSQTVFAPTHPRLEECTYQRACSENVEIIQDGGVVYYPIDWIAKGDLLLLDAAKAIKDRVLELIDQDQEGEEWKQGITPEWKGDA